MNRVDSIRCVSVVHCVAGFVPEPGTSVDYARIRLQSRERERERGAAPRTGNRNQSPEILFQKRGEKRKPAPANENVQWAWPRPTNQPSGVGRMAPPLRLVPPQNDEALKSLRSVDPPAARSFGSSPVSVWLCSDSYLSPQRRCLVWVFVWGEEK